MLKDYFPALKFKNFKIYWIGQLISLIGTWMQSTVLPYLAYQLTDRPFYLGAIGFASAIPAFFLTLPAGVLIEKLDKRKMVIAMQSVMMLQAFALAYFAATNQITIWHILMLSLLMGIATALEIVARQSMFVELVDREALPNAIALNSAVFNVARVFGPTLAMPFLVLLQNGGEGWAFFANGVTYMVVIAGLMNIRTSSYQPQTSRKILQSISFRDFLEGQRFIKKTPMVLLLILMVTIPSFFGFPFIQLIPVFARDVLKAAGDTTAIVASRNGLLLSFQGIGALAGSLILAWVNSRPMKGKILLLGQVSFAIGLLGMGFSRTMIPAGISMFLIGWGTVTQLSTTNTLIQLLVPDSLRGRVISTYFWVTQGTLPFGSLFIGWAAQTISTPTTVLIGGGICLASYLAFHISKPIIRNTTI